MRRRILLVSLSALALGASAAWPAVQGRGETIDTVAGTGSGAIGSGVDGEPATAAAVDHPRGLDTLAVGGFALAEPFRNTVQRVDADGRIFRLAGTGDQGFSGDGGPAVKARLDLVHAVVELRDGGFLLADTGNNRIRRIFPDGTISTVVGTGEARLSGDGGPATLADVNGPRSVSALPDGGLLIPDTGNNRIRRVWPDGTITTVAGTGEAGFSGDGGPAVEARLDLPFDVVPLAGGGFLIAEARGHRIRRVDADGTITRVAGTGRPGFGGDGGPATAAEIESPHAVAALPDGGFLIADTSNNRVRRVYPSGMIRTVAGTGIRAFSGDGGAPTAAALDRPKAIAVLSDFSGFLVGDAGNNRVRLLRVNLRPPLELVVATRRLRSKAGRQATIRYTLSDAATTRVQVLHRGSVVLRAVDRAADGPNRLSFGRNLRPASYRLQLVAITPDGRSARSTASLRVVR